MPVEIGEIVTEVVVDPPGGGSEPAAPDPEALRELVLRLIREELERHERLGEGR